MSTDIPPSDHKRDGFASTHREVGEGEGSSLHRLGAPATDLGAETFYPERSVLTPETSRAFELLQLADDFLQEALDALSDSSLIDADDHVLHARACLEELFVLREIGKGFAMAINGCLGAFSSLNGAPLVQKQIVSMRTVLQAIYKSPFLTAAAADELLDKLERVGLRTEPPGFAELSEILADEGLS